MQSQQFLRGQSNSAHESPVEVGVFQAGSVLEKPAGRMRDAGFPRERLRESRIEVLLEIRNQLAAEAVSPVAQLPVGRILTVYSVARGEKLEYLAT